MLCASCVYFLQAKLEASDKIILPPSALHKLASKNTTYPMMFELSNPQIPDLVQKMHGGVLEFDAPEGQAFLPSWV
jgi:ubiquitin fusion degradation protein 1